MHTIFLFFRSRHVLSTNEIAEVLETLDCEEGVQGFDVYIDPPCDGTISDGDSGEEDCDNINRLNRHQLLAPAEMVVIQGEDDNDDDAIIDEVLVCPTSSSSQIVEPITMASGSRTPGFRSSRHVDPPTAEVEELMITANPDEQSSSNIRSTRVHSSSRRGRRSNVRPRKWVKRDLRPRQGVWSPPPPRAVLTLTKESEPIEFFELFFNMDVIRYIVRHTVMYAVEKHQTGFCLSGDEM